MHTGRSSIHAGARTLAGQGPSAFLRWAVVPALRLVHHHVRSDVSVALSQPNQAPVFTSTGSGDRSVAENTVPGVDIGAQDADNDPLTYTISGADAGAFPVVAATGQLQTKSALNHETKSTYRFTFTASFR